MSTLTAVVTAHNYGRYLNRCIDSALLYCDEILVYDDGSTDDTMAILATYGDAIRVTHRDDATGDPIWGSNLGIEQATSDYLIFLDADNYLTGQPPLLDYDYVFAPIQVVADDERPMALWRFPEYSTDPAEAYRQFQHSPTPRMPFPWGGVWRTSWLKDKRWRGWSTTQFAQDFRTAIDWCKCLPTLFYYIVPFLAFRKHPDQWSEHEDRPVMFNEARVAQLEPIA